MRDIIALGSTCKALAPLRAPWDSLSIDLKQEENTDYPSLFIILPLACSPLASARAQKILRYPNRWFRRLGKVERKLEKENPPFLTPFTPHPTHSLTPSFPPASPACTGLKSPSIARPFTAEINHEIVNWR